VMLIPHGAGTLLAAPSLAFDRPAGWPPRLLTWGLLGPGKGIEHVIEALSLVTDLRPRPRYTVAGVTHPKVFAARGDEYRRGLVQQSWAVGVAASVTFDDTYRDLPELIRFIGTATAVLLPYDSHDQVTSGVLVDAIAAGRPVIATAFPHALELLSTGAGIVVPHGDSVALADAIRLITNDEDALASMAAEARRIAPSLSWSAVAEQYADLAGALVRIATPVAM
jgi:polysaccharide biosynthesis protein PslF